MITILNFNVTEFSYERITNIVCQVFKVPFCSIAILDANKQWLQFTTRSSELIGELENKDSIFEHILKTKKALLISNTASEDSSLTDSKSLVHKFTFFVGIPLWTKENLITGILSIADNVHTTFTDEDMHLFKEFGKLVESKMQLLHYVSEREQIQKEVILAGKLQRKSLPQDLQTEYFDLQSIFQPSLYVSGDYYAYTWDSQYNQFQCVLIDVMGHGIATALQISAIRVLFDEVSKQDISLKDKVDYINKESAKYFNEDSFVALIYIELDIANKKLRYVPAGINNFVHLKKQKQEILSTPGFLVGMFEEAQFDEYEINVEEDDAIYFMTDGLFDNISKNSDELYQNEDYYAYLDAVSRKSDRIDDATAICLHIKKLSHA